MTIQTTPPKYRPFVVTLFGVAPLAVAFYWACMYQAKWVGHDVSPTVWKIVTAFSTIYFVIERVIKEFRIGGKIEEAKEEHRQALNKLNHIFADYLQSPNGKESAYKEVLEDYLTLYFNRAEIRAAFYELEGGEEQGNDEVYLHRKAHMSSHSHMDVRLDPKDKDEGKAKRAKLLINRVREGKTLVVPDVTKKSRDWKTPYKPTNQNYKSFCSFYVERNTSSDQFARTGGLLTLDSKKKRYFSDKNSQWVLHCSEILATILNARAFEEDASGVPKARSDAEGR